ncbi:hypothetical protein EVA_04619 [gut metagenome]|uniref:Uncharacterized protein n=1 Tax=gut metagenome TaxID=749906 RepID=J9GJ64_9ZZZZ
MLLVDVFGSLQNLFYTTVISLKYNSRYFFVKAVSQ